ncbi:hypothetical protein DY468_19390 [Rhodopseudomonas sp. BR0M22]|nr:hypothetical protein [Rhodopseudomonas sp. BR0M22]
MGHRQWAEDQTEVYGIW